MALRISDRPITIAGSIRRAGWNGGLFRSHFRIEVKTGSVAEIKLRCEKKYALLKYEPDIEYTVSAGAGDCEIEVVGEPETTFELTQ